MKIVSGFCLQAARGESVNGFRRWFDTTQVFAALVQYNVFFCDKVGDFIVVNEVRFVLAGGFPFGRLSGREKGVDVVKPKLRHTVVVGSVLVSGNCHGAALYEPAELRNPGADGAMDVLPIAKEVLLSHACLLGDAINQFDHNRPQGVSMEAQNGTSSALPRHALSVIPVQILSTALRLGAWSLSPWLSPPARGE